MDSEIVDAVTEWESRSFSGGYAGLHDLADEGFSGGVTEGVAWLFMVRGRVVGVFDGSIENFEDASGTAYVAPDRALPLLFAMKETGGETRAKYYTNDTSLSEADATLASGSFTGYIELSENVLSGDYYVVYHGGQSMSVAYVGNSQQLLTGEEAFEKADDEVGIYEVKDVDIDVVDIPSPETAIDEAEDATSDDDPDAPVTDDLPDEVESAGTEDESTDETVSSDEPDSPTDEVTDDKPTPADTETTDNQAESVEETEPTDADEPAADEPTSDVRQEPTEPSEADVTNAEIADAEAEDAQADSGIPDPADVATEASEPTDNEQVPDEEGVFSEEEEWREAQSIPSLSPSKSSTSAESDGQSAAQERSRPSRNASPDSERRPRRRTQSPNQQGQQLEQLRERLQAAQQAKQEAESAKERLEAEREKLAQERDEIAQERDQYRERAGQLESRVDELQSQIDRLEQQLENTQTAGSSAERTMSRREVLDSTNLFVRYGSKGGATLEKAHNGEVDRQAVAQNLRLEHHSSFDTEGVQVEGQPYEEFLHNTIEYEFVRWVVTELLYEIQETGHEAGLQELYDAIPRIDRAELHGQASIAYQENGEEHREQQSFDIILRDRMGNPLLVTDVNESRDAATEDMMTSLIENARRVKESSDSLGAAVFVTASFFEPEALETAAGATGGGLLNRSKRESFVKLSRKQGFHLCLVETRNGDFHVNVPEL